MREWKPYICYKCRKTFDLQEAQLISPDLERMGLRCPHCGSRIVMKTRPQIAKRLKAI